MREIKFRAWDGKSIRYDVTGFEHGVNNEMAGIFLDGDFYHIGGDSPIDACAEVMQYTGLLDSKGREIYEGDIIKQIADDPEADYSGPFQVVEYDNESGCYALDVGDDLEIDSCLLGCFDSLYIEIEIIGNIYENPELYESVEEEK